MSVGPNPSLKRTCDGVPLNSIVRLGRQRPSSTIQFASSSLLGSQGTRNTGSLAGVMLAGLFAFLMVSETPSRAGQLSEVYRRETVQNARAPERIIELIKEELL